MHGVADAAGRRCRAVDVTQLWDALAGGAIPIYLGAPNVAEHLPSPSAALVVADPANVAAVVAEMAALEADPARAARRLAWRVPPGDHVAAAFRARLAQLDDVRPESPCGLCERLWRTRHHWDAQRVD